MPSIPLLDCKTCGAVVRLGKMGAHTKWHREQEEEAAAVVQAVAAHAEFASATSDVIIDMRREMGLPV